MPGVGRNLFFVKSVTEKSVVSIFDFDNPRLELSGIKVPLSAEDDDLYSLMFDISVGSHGGKELAMNATTNAQLWHRRLGHFNKRSLELMQRPSPRAKPSRRYSYSSLQPSFRSAAVSSLGEPITAVNTPVKTSKCIARRRALLSSLQLLTRRNKSAFRNALDEHCARWSGACVLTAGYRHFFRGGSWWPRRTSVIGFRTRH